MVIVDYTKKLHKQTALSCAKALKAGKIVAYPTDTSYGLAVDASNIKAIKKLYRLKGRNFNKPIHVVVPSEAFARKIVSWNPLATKLVKKFWPGGLTLVLPLKSTSFGLKKLSAGTKSIGVRMPKNEIALDLAKYLKQPITATSANVSGKKDCYSCADILSQFKNEKFQPDIIINAGRLPKQKPSTVVRIDGNQLDILRQGPVKIKI